jgi:hypothetical protein
MKNDGELGLRELLDAHGTNCLFVGWPLPLQLQSFYGPLAENMAVLATQPEEGDLREKGSKALREIGALLPEYPPPWRNLSTGMSFGFSPVFTRLDAKGNPDLPLDVLRGLALVFAVKVEEQVAEVNDGAPGVQRVEEILEASKAPATMKIRPLLLQRLGAGDVGNKALDDLKFSPSAAALMRQWMAGECDFVEGESQQA